MGKYQKTDKSIPRKDLPQMKGLKELELLVKQPRYTEMAGTF